MHPQPLQWHETNVAKLVAERDASGVVQGFKPRRSIEVVMFTSEEPTRFGISCLGRCSPCCCYNRACVAYGACMATSGSRIDREVPTIIDYFLGLS